MRGTAPKEAGKVLCVIDAPTATRQILRMIATSADVHRMTLSMLRETAVNRSTDDFTPSVAT